MTATRPAAKEEWLTDTDAADIAIDDAKERTLVHIDGSPRQLPGMLRRLGARYELTRDKCWDR
jgi:hypothetical protein